VGGRVHKRQLPQLEVESQHRPQLTGLDRLAPRTSLGSVHLISGISVLWKSNIAKISGLGASSRPPTISTACFVIIFAQLPPILASTPSFWECVAPCTSQPYSVEHFKTLVLNQACFEASHS